LNAAVAHAKHPGHIPQRGSFAHHREQHPPPVRLGPEEQSYAAGRPRLVSRAGL
jgi:hypothetical protein